MAQQNGARSERLASLARQIGNLGRRASAIEEYSIATTLMRKANEVAHEAKHAARSEEVPESYR